MCRETLGADCILFLDQVVLTGCSLVNHYTLYFLCMCSFKRIFFLAALDLSCGTQVYHCSMRVGSFMGVHRLLSRCTVLA